MKRNYSRLASVEEKRNTRKAILFVALSILILIFIITGGVPIITKIIDFVSSFNKSPQNLSLIDKTPPSPPILKSIPDATNKNPFEITGKVEEGNTIVIVFNDSENEIQADEDGEFTTYFDLEKGQNTFFAYTKDAAGNTSKETEINILIYDNEVPTLTNISPSEGTNFYGLKQRNITIKGLTEIDSSVTINDRIASVDNDGNFSLNYSLENGENNLKIKSIDKAGNENEVSLKLFFSE